MYNTLQGDSMLVNLVYIECLRCGHKWLPRKREVRICPRCKSAYWDTPKTNYFRKDKIK